MIKKSYNSKKIERIKKIKNMTVINQSSSNEDGSRGYIFPGIYRGQPFMKNEEDSVIDNAEDSLYKDLKDIMINLSDNLDSNGDVVLADFGDYLIKKIAQVESVDYTHEFNILIKIVNNSDILDKDKKIKELVLSYNSFLKNNLKLSKNSNIKLKAYNVARKKAEEYVR